MCIYIYICRLYSCNILIITQATNCNKKGKTAENCTTPSASDGTNGNVKLPASATYTVC